MAKKRKTKSKFDMITEEQVRKELAYLVSEGFAKYNKNDDTWELISQEELDQEIENV